MSRRNKKKRRKKRQHRSPSEDESIETASEMSSVMSFAQDVDPGFTTRFMGDMEGCLEPLTEKRSMTGGAERSKAHVMMRNLLSKAVWHDWCVKNAHVLKEIYVESLKRGDNSERIKALQTCCCVIITLGFELQTQFSESVSEGILYVVRSHISHLRYDFEGAETWGASRSGEVDPLDSDPEEEVRAIKMVGLAMNILPLMGFTSNESKSLKKIAKILFDIWEDSNYYHDVRAGALQGWVMAVCKLKVRVKGSYLFNKAMPALIQIIEEDPSPSIAELLSAAGSAIALLHEAHFVMQFQEESDSDETDEDNDEETDEYNDRDAVDTEYIKSLMEGISSQSSKGHKKEMIKRQRRNFRKFARALDEDSSSPSVDLKLKKQEFTLLGWTSTICWEYLKRNLAGGLQAHLLGNAWLQSIFGIDGSLFQQVSQVQLKQEKEDQVAERKISSKEQYLKFKKARGLKYQVHNDEY